MRINQVLSVLADMPFGDNRDPRASAPPLTGQSVLLALGTEGFVATACWAQSEMA